MRKLVRHAFPGQTISRPQIPRDRGRLVEAPGTGQQVKLGPGGGGAGGRRPGRVGSPGRSSGASPAEHSRSILQAPRHPSPRPPHWWVAWEVPLTEKSAVPNTSPRSLMLAAWSKEESSGQVSHVLEVSPESNPTLDGLGDTCRASLDHRWSGPGHGMKSGQPSKWGQRHGFRRAVRRRARSMRRRRLEVTSPKSVLVPGHLSAQDASAGASPSHACRSSDPETRPPPLTPASRPHPQAPSYPLSLPQNPAGPNRAELGRPGAAAHHGVPLQEEDRGRWVQGPTPGSRDRGLRPRLAAVPEGGPSSAALQVTIAVSLRLRSLTWAARPPDGTHRTLVFSSALFPPLPEGLWALWGGRAALAHGCR